MRNLIQANWHRWVRLPRKKAKNKDASVERKPWRKCGVYKRLKPYPDCHSMEEHEKNNKVDEDKVGQALIRFLKAFDLGCAWEHARQLAWDRHDKRLEADERSDEYRRKLRAEATVVILRHNRDSKVRNAYMEALLKHDYNAYNAKETNANQSFEEINLMKIENFKKMWNKHGEDTLTRIENLNHEEYLQMLSEFDKAYEDYYGLYPLGVTVVGRPQKRDLKEILLNAKYTKFYQQEHKSIPKDKRMDPNKIEFRAGGEKDSFKIRYDGLANE